jgi:hypothetical protein
VDQPIPKVLRPTTNVQLVLKTDASQEAWGAHLNIGPQELQACSQAWEKEDRRKHITHQEALASAKAVENLLRHIPQGCHLNIQSDATSTVWAWRKGSKIQQLNQPIRQQMVQLAKKRVHVTADHIPGKQNTRADWLSRHPDPKNYRLNPAVYRQVCQHFNYIPEMDMFASKANKQCKKYCSWRADISSQGNAFHMTWTNTKGWMNPPWDIIQQCLQKVKTDKANMLVCLPVWQSAHWWGTLQELLQQPPLVLTNKALYQDPQGTQLPAPRWATLFGVIQG